MTYDYAREIADCMFPSRRLCGLPNNFRPAPTRPHEDEDGVDYEPYCTGEDAEEDSR
jgi:hypothetical protein